MEFYELIQNSDEQLEDITLELRNIDLKCFREYNRQFRRKFSRDNERILIDLSICKSILRIIGIRTAYLYELTVFLYRTDGEKFKSLIVYRHFLRLFSVFEQAKIKEVLYNAIRDLELSNREKLLYCTKKENIIEKGFLVYPVQEIANGTANPDKDQLVSTSKFITTEFFRG